MRAARLHEYHKPLIIEEIETPRISDSDGVLLRVAGAGACHSDLHVIEGELGLSLQLPCVLGHEISGYVSEIGPDVISVRRGDPVLVYGGWGCGSCDFCIRGDEQLCSKPRWPGLGQMYQGGFAEFMYIPSARHLIQVEGDPTDLAPLTDAALTPYRAVKKVRAQLLPSSYSLVIGLGGLGLLGLQFLKLLTGSQVIAVDNNESKLRPAQELGAEHAIDSTKDDPLELIMRATLGKGADAVLDFVCSPDTTALAMKSLSKQGTYVAVGLGGGSLIEPTRNLVRGEVILTGSHWGNHSELREVYSLYKAGKFKLKTERYELEQINGVFMRLKSGEVSGRAVLTP